MKTASIPPWHALLAPLPDDATPVSQPVASPEVLATPEGAAIAGWMQLTVHLSAGAAGLRNVLVVLDAEGRAISANDTVLYRRERPAADTPTGPGSDGGAPEVEYLQESIGGRFGDDGGFLGTRWRSVTIERADEQAPRIESTPAEPARPEVEALRALVAEMLRRAARRR